MAKKISFHYLTFNNYLSFLFLHLLLEVEAHEYYLMTQLFNTIKAILVALFNFLKKNHILIVYFCFTLAILCCCFFIIYQNNVIIYQNNEIFELNNSFETLNELDSKKKSLGSGFTVYQ